MSRENVSTHLQHGHFPQARESLVVALNEQLRPPCRRLGGELLDVELRRRRFIVVSLERVHLEVLRRHLGL